MPLRSFGCEDCEFEWDELVPMDGTAETCPNCGKTNIKTMITSAPAVRLMSPVPCGSKVMSALEAEVVIVLSASVKG